MKTFATFAEATAKENAFAPNGVLKFMPRLPDFAACLADPNVAPDMSAFIALRELHLSIFNAVWSENKLDALIYPQMRSELGPLNGSDIIHETTVSEINIAGLPGVTVPAGFYASGAPFNPIIVGPQWSEADILGIAFAYDQATKYRRPAEFDVTRT